MFILQPVPLALLLLIILSHLSTAASRTCTKPPKPETPTPTSFCRSPPTVPVELPLYTGTWFQIFASGSALQFSNEPCTTANYTLLADGSVAVLNCKQGKPRTTCVRARAVPQKAPGKLIVSFPASPPGPGNPSNYNVAALIRLPFFGYLGAAVYQCIEIPGVPGNRPGFYILSRITRFRAVVLELLKRQLECSGYDVSFKFTPIKQKGCTYFFDEPGFDIQM